MSPKAEVQWRSGRIRLSPKKMTQLRIDIHERAGGRCENEIRGKRCNRMATWDGWSHGECHHKVHRSQGGSDTLENCAWWCWRCHDDIHNGRVNGKLQHSEIQEDA